MNMMSLLYKEFVVNKLYLFLIVPSYLFGLVFGFIFMEEEPTMFYYIFVEFPLIMTATFIGLDEYKKGEVLIASLPIGRKRIIYGKYLAAFTLTALCFVTALITAFTANKIVPNSNYHLIMTFSYGFTSLFICIFLMSIILPLVTRFGVLIGLGSFAVFIYVYFFALPKDFFLNGFYMIANVYEYSGSIGNLPALISIIAAVFLISMIISGKLYESKEIVRS